jgi:hypothetical protein
MHLLEKRALYSQEVSWHSFLLQAGWTTGPWCSYIAEIYSRNWMSLLNLNIPINTRECIGQLSFAETLYLPKIFLSFISCSWKLSWRAYWPRNRGSILRIFSSPEYRFHFTGPPRILNSGWREIIPWRWSDRSLMVNNYIHLMPKWGSTFNPNFFLNAWYIITSRNTFLAISRTMMGRAAYET